MKYGQCTNENCKNYGKTVELQDWWDLICQVEECGAELKEIQQGTRWELKKYLLMPILLLVVGYGVFTVIQGLNKESQLTNPSVVDDALGFSISDDTTSLSIVNGTSDNVDEPSPSTFEPLAFPELEGYLKKVASPDLSESEISEYVRRVLALCANPNIEVKLVSRTGVVTERLSISDFLDRLQLIQEDDFKVEQALPVEGGNKVVSLVIQESNIG